MTLAAAGSTETTDTFKPNPTVSRLFNQRGNLMRGDYSGDNYPPNGYILDLVVFYDNNMTKAFGEMAETR